MNIRALASRCHTTALRSIYRERGLPIRINSTECRVDPQYRWLRGNYEPHVAELLRAVLRPGMLVWDVGANVGVYPLQFGHVAHFRCFEPNPAAAEVLEHHIVMNNLGALVAISRMAISDRVGTVAMAIDGANGMGHIEGHGKFVSTNSIGVPVSTLDHEALSWEIPDVLLLDIEGYEIRALAGASLCT